MAVAAQWLLDGRGTAMLGDKLSKNWFVFDRFDYFFDSFGTFLDVLCHIGRWIWLPEHNYSQK